MNADKEKNREYQRRYREKDPEKWKAMKREASRKFRKEHPERVRAIWQTWKAANPEKAKQFYRAGHLKKYGLTIETFNTLSDKQGGCCAICRRKEKLHVDHCHNSGKIRGLLCHGCNTGLGLFLESVDSLKQAVYYLQKNEPAH